MKRITAIFFFLSISGIGFGQYALEFGASLGAANYLGEIGGSEGPRRDFVLDMKLQATRPSGGLYVKYKLFPELSVGATLRMFQISGADSLSTYANRRTRNLSFRNNIYELGIRAEYNYYSMYDVARTGRYDLTLKNYIYVGANVFYHNPQTQYLAEWVDLQPLETEGVSYSRIQPSVPFGFGFTLNYRRVHNFTYEMTYNLTFTDYLDDASGFYLDPESFEDPVAKELANRTDELGNIEDDPDYLSADYYGVDGAIRGNPEDNDAYLSVVLSYGYSIRGKYKNNRFNTRRRRGSFGTSRRRSRRSRAKF